MKKIFTLFTATLALSTIQTASGQTSILSQLSNVSQTNNWSASELSRLRSWMIAAPKDALPNVPITKFDQAIASGNQAFINRIANEEALNLGRMHLMGYSSKTQRAGWSIKSDDEKLNLAAFLQNKLKSDNVDGFFVALRPRHKEYMALRNAYKSETNSQRRKQLSLNMERWRWMPLKLGRNHLIINIPYYKITYWQSGVQSGIWPVIVGKKSSPTPIFNSVVSGVTFNPWWEIPQSIVRESIGALVRRKPAEARRRGYVVHNGRYRQRPGPNNALGLMKLAMPNPYSVYIHDTPNKALFEKEVRTFSHGCIRTGDAIGFAKMLVKGSKSASGVDDIIAKGQTIKVPLKIATPVYIAYFTASIDEDGKIAYHPDVYKRDGRLDDAPVNGK